MIVSFIYNYLGCLESCEGGELKVGEEVKITLELKNPLWPPTIIGKVTNIVKTHNGRDYTIQFDNAVLNGAPNFDGCDCLIEAYCCCDKILDHKIVTRTGNKVNVKNFDGTSECAVSCPPIGTPVNAVPKSDINGDIVWVFDPSAILYDFNGNLTNNLITLNLVGSNGTTDTVVLDLTPYLDDTDIRIRVGQTVTLNASGIGTAIVENKAGVQVGTVTFDATAIVASVAALANHKIVNRTGNKVTTTNFDGTAECAVGCPPVGTVVGAIPEIGPLGEVIWKLPATDVNTTYDLNGNLTNNLITLNLVGSNGIVDTVTFDLTPYLDDTDLRIRNGQTVVFDALGNGSAIIENKAGVQTGTLSFNASALVGTGGGGDIAASADPTDTCSLRLTVGTGTVSGVGRTNVKTNDPSSTEHTHLTASYVGHNFTVTNPSANAGVNLPANNGETRGEKADFLKSTEVGTGCDRITRLSSGRRVGSTAVFDKDFYSDTPRIEREDHPFRALSSFTASNAGQINAEVYRFQGGTHLGDMVFDAVGKHAVNMTELHTTGVISFINGEYRVSGFADFKELRTQIGATLIGTFGSNNDPSLQQFITLFGKFDIKVSDITSNVQMLRPIQINASGKLVGKNVTVSDSRSIISCSGIITDFVDLEFGNLISNSDTDPFQTRGGVFTSDYMSFSLKFANAKAVKSVIDIGDTQYCIVRGNKAESVSQDILVRNAAILCDSVSDGHFHINHLLLTGTNLSPLVDLNESNLTFYNTKFETTSNATEAVFVISSNNCNLVFNGCRVLVSNPLTPLFNQFGTSNIYIDYELKTNSTVLSIGVLPTIVSGTVILGANVI
jgi:hypothetical protein